jgi:hypothetical protein
MPGEKPNGSRVLIMVAIAGALAIGGSYSLGFTHNHSDYIKTTDLTAIKVQLAEMCVKLDLILDHHEISFSDETRATSPK